MGLKILHSADWHLDSPFASFSPEQREYLKKKQLEIPGKIKTLVKTRDCDLVLLAGDLFDGAWNRDTLDLVRDTLAACRVPVFIAPGNHDHVGPESPWEERWPGNVRIFRGGLESVALPELDCRVWGAGFASMDSPALLEGFRAEGAEPFRVAVLHGDPTSAASPCNPVTAAQVRTSGLQYLALGHIHKGGTLRAGGTLCAWPGCPMGRGWDETGDKGVFLAEVEQTAKVKGISLDTPRFYQQELEINGDAARMLERVLPGADTRDFYRVTLTGRGRPDLRGLLRQFAHVPNLELRDKTTAPADLWADAGADSLRGAYFGILKELSLDPEQAEQAKLAAEISLRLLEGREVTLP